MFLSLGSPYIIPSFSICRTNIESQLVFLKAETASGDECEHRQHSYKPSDGKHKYKQFHMADHTGNVCTGRAIRCRRVISVDQAREQGYKAAHCGDR